VRVLQRLGVQHALVVYGQDGLDELSLGAASLVGELKDGEVREYELHPEDFGLAMAAHAPAAGGRRDPECRHGAGRAGRR
jgi:anthranilate phosphoribosyltransferase